MLARELAPQGRGSIRRMASSKSTSPVEVEYPPPVERFKLLNALDSLIKNYERAIDEGSWVARELAALLDEVRKNLGITKVHCIEMVDQICQRAVTMRHTTRTSKDRPVPVNQTLDSIVAEVEPFLPDLHARLVDPAVRRALLNAARDYANPKLSEVDRATAVLAVLGVIKPSWTASAKTTVSSVRMAIRRSRERRHAERTSR